MLQQGRSFTFVLLLLVIAAFGCNETKEERVLPRSGGESLAYSTLASILDDGAQLRFVDEQRFPDGRFSHLRVRLSPEHPGQLAAKFALDRYGDNLSLHQAKQRFNREYQKRWGALDFSTAAEVERLDRLSIGQKRFSIWYNPKVLPDNQLEKELEQLGAAPRHNRKHAIASIRTTFDQALEIAHEPGVVTVSVLPERFSNLSASDADSVSAAYVGSDDTFNAEDLYGEDIKIGLVEGITYWGEHCGIFEQHEALNYTTVDYLTTPSSCSSDSDCTPVCDSPTMPGICVNGTCLTGDGHADRVVSRISSSVTDQPLHAAASHLMIANTGDDIIDSVELSNAYAALHDENVRLVNESWGTGTQFVATDFVRDWYGRYRDMTFVQGAGNQGADFPVFCRALNSVCVGGTDASRSYNDYLDDVMHESSAWKNPRYSFSHPDGSLQGTPKDAERPDVVSEAKDAKVMDRSDPKAWTTDSGNSFSTPTITGLIALFWDDCDREFSPALNRAALRTAAYTPHQLEPPGFPSYPTPGQSGDSKAGAGISHAHGMSLYCSPQEDGPELDLQEGEIDPTDDTGWETIPSYMTPDEFPEMEQSYITTHDEETASQELRTSDTVVRPLWDVGPAGRVRVTFSFYTCPPSAQDGTIDPTMTVNKLEPAVDFDLIMCADESETCLGLSESLDDTNEGFDVTIPAELQEENWRVFLAKPSAEVVTPCAGPQDGREPWGSAIAVWR